jgi:DUF1680 family protein
MNNEKRPPVPPAARAAASIFTASSATGRTRSATPPPTRCSIAASKPACWSRSTPALAKPGHPLIPIQPWGGTTQMFWDSDLGKSIETVAYSLYRRRKTRNSKPDRRRSSTCMRRCRTEDGYLNAWFQRVQPDRAGPICATHELYCAGHLIEGAVAYFQATGKRKLLDIMCRYADDLSTRCGRRPAARLLRP